MTFAPLSRRPLTLALAALTFTLTACPGDPATEDGGSTTETDAGGGDAISDAGQGNDDAGSSGEDAGSAGPDAGMSGDDAGMSGDAGTDTDAGMVIDVDAGPLPSVTLCDVVDGLFTPRCVGCHDGNYQFDLREDAAREGLVDVASTRYEGALYVVPGDAEESFLYQKLAGTHAVDQGGTMPPGSTVSSDELDLVYAWIEGGAETTCDEEPELDLVYLSPEAHLRRVAMALTGMRPTASELAEVREDPSAIEDIIDDYMDRPQFGETIRDMHNEALLVRTAKNLQLFFPSVGALKDLKNADASYNDAARINRELMEAPLRTAEFIVATDRPYTEVVTGDYVVGTPAFEAVWGNGALRSNVTWYGFFPTTMAVGAAYDFSEDPYGVGPAADFDVYRWEDGRGAAGVISSNAFMARWPSAGANYNRGRANAVSKAFLCYDYLQNPVDVSSEGGIDLADPEAVANAVSDPTTSCWGCHATLDPLATYMQPFRPAYFPGAVAIDGYPFAMHSDLFAHGGTLDEFYSNGRNPGYFVATAEEPNPAPVDVNGDGRINAGDLGQSIADDPRFTSCTVKRFYSFFTQRELHDIPADTLELLEAVLVGSEYSAKTLVKEIMLSDAMRVSHAASEDGADDVVGILRARPSQAARALKQASGWDIVFPNDFAIGLLPDGAAAGEEPMPYGNIDYLRDDFVGFRELGGGIDGFTVTRPVKTFTGGTGSAYRWIGNFAGQIVVFQDFQRPANQRYLFTAGELTASDEDTVRALLAEVHFKLLGLEVVTDSEEVDALWALWSDLHDINGNSPVRAWFHVTSALLQDIRFTTY